MLSEDCCFVILKSCLSIKDVNGKIRLNLEQEIFNMKRNTCNLFPHTTCN